MTMAHAGAPSEFNPIVPAPPARHRCLIAGKPNALSRCSLVCFPYAGSGASTFLRWGGRLPASIQICGVQYPGRESRLDEPPVQSLDLLLDELIPALLPLLDRPVVFFGYSLGALIAFETARALRDLGCPGPRWLCLAAGRPPERVGDVLPDLRLSDGALFDQVEQRYGRFPDEVRLNPEWRQLAIPILRADISILANYRYEPGAPLDADLSVLMGASDSQADAGVLEGWRRHVAGEFELRSFRGGHFFLREDATALLGFLGDRIVQVS
jgi:surfactin synthase thioesterase subunit